MNFMSPYHRTLIPDPPMDGAHLSPGLGPNSPILAQLSPKVFGNSPSLSPKPTFAESLKARLSLSRKSVASSPGLTSRNGTPHFSTINQFPIPTGEGQTFGQGEDDTDVAEMTPRMKFSKFRKAKQSLIAARPATSPMVGQQSEDVGLGFSPAILFNGKEMEPTRPLKFQEPSSAGGRLGGSPSQMLSPSSPTAMLSPGSLSPMLHVGAWGRPVASAEDTGALSPESAYSPLIDSAAASPQITFGADGSPAWTDGDKTPLQHMDASRFAPQSPLHGTTSASALTSPQHHEQATPRPRSSDADEFGLEGDLDYMSQRDSMISVAASTISMMSNSTCKSESVGEEMEKAADRRTKLLESVQLSLAKTKEKEAKRESQAADRYRRSQMSQMSRMSMSQSSSLRNIPEEISGSTQTMGLGLYESEEEGEDDEEKENLQDSLRT